MTNYKYDIRKCKIKKKMEDYKYSWLIKNDYFKHDFDRFILFFLCKQLIEKFFNRFLCNNNIKKTNVNQIKRKKRIKPFIYSYWNNFPVI